MLKESLPYSLEGDGLPAVPSSVPSPSSLGQDASGPVRAERCAAGVVLSAPEENERTTSVCSVTPAPSPGHLAGLFRQRP